MQDSDRQVGLALRLIDDTWAELSRNLPAAYGAAGLPQISEAEARRKAEVGRGLLARIAALDLAALPHELALTVAVARARAQTWAREGDWFWTVFDPSGVGFFGMFAATSYAGGYLLSGVLGALQTFAIKDEAAADRYLALVEDYARLVRQLAERTRGQTERGVRMPRAQAAQAAPLLERLKVRSLEVLRVAEARLSGVAAAGFSADLDRRLAERVAPAFDAFLAEVDEAYVAAAPETVGLAQYPDGPAIYGELVRLHTTLDLDPREVHARGLARMAEVRAQMAQVRAEDGFDGDDLAYRARLDADPRWRAADADGVTAIFQTYIDRIRAKLDDYFPFGPKATYGVLPLPQALEASMTFGFYDMPKPDRRAGYYMFNAANLTQAGLYNLGSLTYHELVPGHHFHIASQQENLALHPLRANSFVNAYNEGWAEYAATLAGEMGLYPTAAERFGRLVMDAFLTCRLVVDTGMNALGWSLEQARDYMRENSFMPETEICSESLRYSCDIPGQSLAYKLGDTEILRMRESMREALGNRFDIKAFHAAVLEPGALPLPLLAEHVARETRRLAESP